MPNTITDYYSLFTSKNLARTNRFQVVISLPRSITAKFNGKLREISLLVESAEIPGRAIEAFDYNPNGIGFQAATGMIYEKWNVRFRLMEDFMVKDVLDAWMDLVHNPNNMFIGFRDDYVSTATVSPLNLNNEAIETYTLQEVYPQIVQTIALDNTSENTYMTLGATFSYTKWN